MNQGALAGSRRQQGACTGSKRQGVLAGSREHEQGADGRHLRSVGTLDAHLLLRGAVGHAAETTLHDEG